MTIALALARRGLGQVWPNPSVGCVILDTNGAVVGRGWTQPGGRPHAETEALKRAGAAARGGTAYVTLEPCNHHGRTPPCTEAMLAAGIARLVSTVEDPDPRVCGAGFERLRQAGVQVETGLFTDQAQQVNEGFLTKAALGRPFVALKTATSLDGKIALANGESQWITGPEARQYAHRMRAEFDAVMVGSGTARQDDPSLTCRLPGYAAPSPVRIVVASDPDAAVARDANLRDGAAETWLICPADIQAADPDWVAGSGIAATLPVPVDARGKLDLSAALKRLGQRGVTRVMVEGGGALAASLLRADLVDELHWARAPKIIGAEGLPAIGGLELTRLAQSEGFRLDRVLGLGADEVAVYTRRDPIWRV